jgi:hypothetical protein
MAAGALLPMPSHCLVIQCACQVRRLDVAAYEQRSSEPSQNVFLPLLKLLCAKFRADSQPFVPRQ